MQHVFVGVFLKLPNDDRSDVSIWSIFLVYQNKLQQQIDVENSWHKAWYFLFKTREDFFVKDDVLYGCMKELFIVHSPIALIRSM